MNKRGPEHFQAIFEERDLAEIVKLQKAQANKDVKKDLTKYVADALADNKSAKEIINEVKEYSQKYNLVEHEVVTIVSGEKNKTKFIIYHFCLRLLFHFPRVRMFHNLCILKIRSGLL